jgi:hypothetical protein
MAWWAILLIAIGCALLGVIIGYIATLLYIGKGFRF